MQREISQGKFKSLPHLHHVLKKDKDWLAVRTAEAKVLPMETKVAFSHHRGLGLRLQIVPSRRSQITVVSQRLAQLVLFCFQEVDA